MATRSRIAIVFLFFIGAYSKSTIEPCSVSTTCPALLGYTLYADLKLSELAALFQIDPISVLTANSIIPSTSPNTILPSGLFLRIPTLCSCSGGIRRSLSTRYTTRPADTLASISSSIFAGLASPEQISDANSLGNGDPDASLDVGESLVIPLPCSCFNNSDDFLPAVYLSYLVGVGDTVAGIAGRYETTVTDIMNVNALGVADVKPGDILAIPLPACSSNLPQSASDFGLVVANGSYAITADHCVQCSCGPGNLNLYCIPASLPVSCSSMQCRNSNLMLGNVTSQATSAGCNVTSCSYNGFVNGTILTTLSTSLQPLCPGVHQFPAVIPPPTEATHEQLFAPSPSPIPSEAGGAIPTPKTSAPGSFSLPGVSPANGPAGSLSGATSSAVNLFDPNVFMYFQFLFLVLLI